MWIMRGVEVRIVVIKLGRLVSSLLSRGCIRAMRLLSVLFRYIIVPNRDCSSSYEEWIKPCLE
jgi:hypothetical protein